MSDESPKLSANTGAATTSSPAEASCGSRDDMIDMPEDFNRWPFLRHVMGEYRDVLVETYLDSDRTSLAAQARHKRWVLCAAFLATLAVSLAILQLAGLRVRGIVWLEVMSVVLAALTFWLGYKSRREWLKERHKAEQCRFLKFRSLISPEVHAEGNLPAEVCTRQFSREIETLKTITYEDVGEWLVEDELPSPPGRIVGRSLEDLAQLRGYYREKRLEFQAAYFKRQSERNVKGDQQWRRVPAWLFVGSVICVGLHSVIESTPLNAYALRFVPRLVCDVPLFLLSFIALAALLPVFGSGIRTWRSSREATRNMSRFRAKYVALRNISQRLAGNRIKDDTEAEAILRDIWCSEQIMESEHREWLRLMMEAEWMG